MVWPTSLGSASPEWVHFAWAYSPWLSSGWQEDKLQAWIATTQTQWVSLAPPLLQLGDTRRATALLAPHMRWTHGSHLFLKYFWLVMKDLGAGGYFCICQACQVFLVTGLTCRVCSEWVCNTHNGTGAFQNFNSLKPQGAGKYKGQKEKGQDEQKMICFTTLTVCN